MLEDDADLAPLETRHAFSGVRSFAVVREGDKLTGPGTRSRKTGKTRKTKKDQGDGTEILYNRCRCLT